VYQISVAWHVASYVQWPSRYSPHPTGHAYEKNDTHGTCNPRRKLRWNATEISRPVCTFQRELFVGVGWVENEHEGLADAYLT